MEKTKPLPVKNIDDLETLKVLADPFRNQVLEILAAKPLTINQIAEKLGVSPSKLYYHINLLEKHGLIRIVDTHIKANIIEKQYWVTAYDYKLSEDLCNFTTPEGQHSVITTMVAPIETTREDILRSLEARAAALEHGAEQHPRDVIVFRELREMSDAEAETFLERLREVAHEFDAFENQDTGSDVHTRALTIAFYPSFYYSETREG
jgi:DNA-binding transcriptional ArsR family regulator